MGPVALTHDLHLSADPGQVWELTRDIEGWPALTPTMTAVTRLDGGALGVGSTALVRQPRLRPATWTVTAFEPPRRFVWHTTLGGVRLAAAHLVEPEAAGTRHTLSLDLAGARAGALARVAGAPLRRALATENDGFRRAAEGLARPRFVDEHRFRVDLAPDRVWPAVRGYADRLAGASPGRLLGVLLDPAPGSGFGVADEAPGRRVGLAGRHRFSRYWLDLRVDPACGSGSEVSAVTCADFPGPHGSAYRAAVVGSRAHVLAVRRMLGSIREQL